MDLQDGFPVVTNDIDRLLMRYRNRPRDRRELSLLNLGLCAFAIAIVFWLTLEGGPAFVEHAFPGNSILVYMFLALTVVFALVNIGLALVEQRNALEDFELMKVLASAPSTAMTYSELEARLTFRGGRRALFNSARRLKKLGLVSDYRPQQFGVTTRPIGVRPTFLGRVFVAEGHML